MATKLNGQKLVNAEVDVNRAVFLMNARSNIDHEPFKSIEPSHLTDAYIKEIVQSAIKNLNLAIADME